MSPFFLPPRAKEHRLRIHSGCKLPEKLHGGTDNQTRSSVFSQPLSEEMRRLKSAISQLFSQCLPARWIHSRCFFWVSSHSGTMCIFVWNIYTRPSYKGIHVYLSMKRIVHALAFALSFWLCQGHIAFFTVKKNLVTFLVHVCNSWACVCMCGYFWIVMKNSTNFFCFVLFLFFFLHWNVLDAVGDIFLDIFTVNSAWLFKSWQP